MKKKNDHLTNPCVEVSLLDIYVSGRKIIIPRKRGGYRGVSHSDIPIFIAPYLDTSV